MGLAAAGKGPTKTIEKRLAAAAALYPVLGAADAAELAEKAGVTEGRARTRLLTAHLQGGEEAQAIALCAAAVAKRAEFALFCRELITHAPVTPRTMKALREVLLSTFPTHPIARLDPARPILAAPVYDAMWSGGFLVAHHLSADFGKEFEGLLVSTEEPLSHMSTVSGERREGGVAYMTLHEKDQLISDTHWVAPPSILISGTLGPAASRNDRAKAKWFRAKRRLTAILQR